MDLQNKEQMSHPPRHDIQSMTADFTTSALQTVHPQKNGLQYEKKASNNKISVLHTDSIKRQTDAVFDSFYFLSS
jgi:hypothetical protein